MLKAHFLKFSDIPVLKSSKLGLVEDYKVLFIDLGLMGLDNRSSSQALKKCLAPL